jgi:hypothetical protein
MILEEPARAFVEAAQAALQADMRHLAESLIQQSLVLRDCHDDDGNVLDRDALAKYFRDLSRQDDDFREDFRIAMERLQRSLAKIETRPQQSTALPGGLTSLSPRPKPDRHDNSRMPSGGFGTMSVTTSWSRQASPPSATRNEYSVRHGTMSSGKSDALSGPSLKGPSGELEVIDRRYGVRQSSFFVIGRVFAILWHASFGSNVHSPQHSWTREGRFGERIISHIQRMVVVKEEHGSSWCIPINTYNGQGVEKFAKHEPLSDADKRDIEAHAIIYMSDGEAKSRNTEPKMSKHSIKVVPAGEDQKLDPMSRVNFAKVHTVEHNFKVMDVGIVEKNSLPYFKLYWREKADEELTHSARQRPRR